MAVSKLSIEDKALIIKRFDNGESKSSLAREFNVSVSLINNITTSPKRDWIYMESKKNSDPELYKQLQLSYKEMYGGW